MHRLKHLTAADQKNFVMLELAAVVNRDSFGSNRICGSQIGNPELLQKIYYTLPSFNRPFQSRAVVNKRNL